MTSSTTPTCLYYFC